jgi:hypothetical protein
MLYQLIKVNLNSEQLASDNDKSQVLDVSPWEHEAEGQLIIFDLEVSEMF